MKRLFISLLTAALFFTGAAGLEARIIGKQVTYRSGSTVLKGYIAWDNSRQGRRPGIIVVHEWWGHNAYARKRARMLAGLGYTAFALDMYGNGKQARHPKEAMAFSGAVSKNMPQAVARFKAAMRVLKRHRTVNRRKIGAIGYCFGGGVVLEMARRGLRLRRVASFHGSLGTKNPARRGRVRAQILVLNGAADKFVKASAIAAFKKEMRKARVRFKFVNYPGAIHAFTNPGSTAIGKKFKLPLAYNAEADYASWKEMQRFFRKAFR